MSGILETIAANQTKIISLLEVIAGANGTTAGIPQVVTQAAGVPAAPAKELEPGVDIGTVTDASTLDVRGFPWDSRIHAKTKTTNKDGSWKYGVGIDRETFVPQVEAELRSQGYGQPAGAGAAAPAAPTLGAPTAAATPGLPPTAPVAPAIPSIPVAPAAKIEFPVIADPANVEDNELTVTAAALMSKHGADVLKALLTLFTVPEGGTALDVPETHRYAFWQYASNDDHLRSQSLIK